MKKALLTVSIAGLLLAAWWTVIIASRILKSLKSLEYTASAVLLKSYEVNGDCQLLVKTEEGLELMARSLEPNACQTYQINDKLLVRVRELNNYKEGIVIKRL